MYSKSIQMQGLTLASIIAAEKCTIPHKFIDYSLRLTNRELEG